jgi:hypothetical protein
MMIADETGGYLLCSGEATWRHEATAGAIPFFLTSTYHTGTRASVIEWNEQTQHRDSSENMRHGTLLQTGGWVAWLDLLLYR